MALRTVTGKLLHPDGSAWASGTIKFQLLESFETATEVYPAEVYTETLDANGEFTITLGVPATGTAHYRITLPDNNIYDTYLASGAATDLMTLLTIASSSVIQSAVQTVIDTHAASLAAHTDLTALDVATFEVNHFALTVPAAGVAVLEGRNRPINVKDAAYGAHSTTEVGYETFDSTVAIQAALTAAGLIANGATVETPVGKYLLSSGITIPANVRLTGDGYGSWLFFENGAGIATAITINAASIEIDHLRISGSTATPTVSRLIGTYAGASNVKIHHNWLSGANKVPGTSALAAVLVEGGTDIWVTDNVFSSNGAINDGTEICCGISSVTTQAHIRNNTIVSSLTIAGIMLFNATDSDVMDNYVDQGNHGTGADTNGYGITVYGGSGTCLRNNVSGNIVKNSYGSGIYFATADYVVVSDNLVYDTAKTQSDATLPVAGISLNGVNNATVTGNVINTSGKDGIVVAASSLMTIAGNTIKNTVKNGINLRGANVSIAICDNIIDACTATGIFSSGGSAAGVRVANNIVTNTGAQAIIFTTSFTDSSIIDNYISVFVSGGIYVTGAVRVNISDNNVINLPNGAYAIDYEGTTGVVARNNIYSAIAGTIGIYANAATETLINDNTVNVVATGIYDLGGTRNRIIDNRITAATPLNLAASAERSGNRLSAGAMQGNAVLVAGQVTVNTAEVLAGDRVLLSNILLGGTAGFLTVGTIVAATSFVIQSSNGADTSTVFWQIVH